MASALRTVSVSRRLDSPPERVFEVFNNYSGWRAWAGFPSVSLERVGEVHPSGVGAIRRFALIPPVREEIVTYEPSRSMSYTLLSGAPIRDHLGHVSYEADGDGCYVHWQTQYRPIIPGSGAITDIVVRWFFGRILSRLQAHLAKPAGQ